MNNKLDVLLICERPQAITYLARRLEQLDCSCSFARNTREVSALLKNHSFGLVLSTRPVIEGSVLLRLLCRTRCFIFYSFPVEDGYLWFQALPEPSGQKPAAVLRSSEFMSTLIDLIGRLREAAAARAWCEA